MNVEQTRLDTFRSWPANAEVESQRIAKAGFFYTGNAMEVECFCCGCRISEWFYGDQVMARHRQLNPECSFVKDPMASGNIPIVNRSSSLYSQVSESSHSSLPSSFSEGNHNLPSITSEIVNNSGDDSINVQGPDEEHQSSSGSRTHESENSQQGNIEVPSFSSVDSPYKSELLRLETFASWPKSHIVSPSLLAKNGFFYLQESDKVQCAFCHGKIRDWDHGDDPKLEHRRHFPSCPFVSNLATGNISLQLSAVGAGVSDSIHPASASGVAEELRPFSIPERGCLRLLNERVQPDLSNLGILTHRGPKQPKYSTVESRLRSFANWPAGLCQSPQQLAQAGFYYTGMNDHVRCFHCDGGLRQWDVQDDPWVEHARWFSKCTYIMLVKGDAFIQNAVAQYPPLLPVNEVTRTVRVATRRDGDQTTFRIRQVTEEELDGLMNTPEVRDALTVGLESSQIRRALRQKMEQTGLPFTSSDALIEGVFNLSLVHPGNLRDGHSSVTERTDVSSSTVAFNSRCETCDERPTSSLSSAKSLPSFAGFQSESCLDGKGPKAQSMPRLPLDKRSAKVLLENESLLEEENRKLKEARLCKICMDEEVGAVFVPCGHLATCVNCAASVQDCPMCRQPIKATVRTFLS